MATRSPVSPLLVVLAAATAFLGGRASAAPPAAPLGTAIPFQGFLQENGVNVTGTRDLSFTLFDAPAGGNQVGPTVTRTGLAITNGLYATSLDFGAAPWTSGEARWIEVAVGTQVLSPRTQVLPAPQALYASQAGNAAQLGGIPAATFARLYGTGEGGNLVKNTPGDTNLADLPTGAITSFQDISITSGALVVPTGTILRCTGSFTLGTGATLRVTTSTAADALPGDTLQQQPSLIAPGRQGIGMPPIPPDYGVTPAVITAGVGGVGIGAARGAVITDPGPVGGASATTMRAGPHTIYGGDGGGTVIIRCAGPVSIAGTIQADGSTPVSAFAGGGGGGGVILVGSGTSISVAPSGLLTARGGDGANGNPSRGGSGGGGGGLVHLVAPSISQLGTVNVNGGTGGTGAPVPPGSPAVAGSGGGGSCGSGGTGGSVAGLVAFHGNPGLSGCFFTTQINPAGFW